MAQDTFAYRYLKEGGFDYDWVGLYPPRDIEIGLSVKSTRSGLV